MEGAGGWVFLEGAGTLLAGVGACLAGGAGACLAGGAGACLPGAVVV